MSKLVAMLFAASGAVVTSVGGVWMLKQGSKSGEAGNPEPSLLFDSVEDFNKVTDSSKWDCLKDYFGNLNIQDLSGKVTSPGNLNPTSGTFFKTVSGQTSPYKSCLLINWKKTTYGTGNNAKGNGKFTWLGTFVKGEEGFINFNVAETNDSDPAQLKLSGVFYLVGKNGDNWEIKHKKDAAAGKTVEASSVSSMFPKKGKSLTDSTKPYWEFLDDNGTLTNMCKKDACGKEATPTPKSTVKTFSGTGSSSNDGANSLKEGCEKLDWGTTLYGSDWNLGDKLNTFKGTGTDNSNQNT